MRVRVGGGGVVSGRRDEDKAERWEQELEDAWYAYVHACR